MYEAKNVLDFWFPDNGHWNSLDSYNAFWRWRMRGGADEDVCSRFAGLARAAARGELDHWAETARNRLALLIALDQFPRSLWRDTPGAYGQDIKGARLALEGMDNGHYEALERVWERQFYLIAISHCEGPDHLARMDMVIEMSKANLHLTPLHLRTAANRAVEQAERVRDVIARFGRHPHRNAILGRISTVAEEEYLAVGEFPHESEIPVPKAAN